MLVSQGDITYLQVVGSMMIVVLCFFVGMREDEELKTPRHASAAATRDDRLPQREALIRNSKSIKLNVWISLHLSL